MFSRLTSFFKKKEHKLTYISETLDISPGRPLRIYEKSGKHQDISTDELVGTGRNSFKGWLCGLGVESLFVNPDGNIFGASCGVLSKLGNIFEDFKVPNGWTTCTRRHCTCGSDLFIPKVKNEAHLPILRKTFGQETQKQLQISNVKKIAGMERTHAANEKQIYWEIGRRCNYNCSYCWTGLHNNYENHKSLESLIAATNKVIQKFAQGNRVNFIISGGEPTLNPDFLEWAKFISTAGHTLSMHSNGSRLPDYYRELIHLGNLNISVHFEFYKRDRLIKVVEAITNEKVKNQNQNIGHLEIKLMMAPGRREEALELSKALNAIPDFSSYCTISYVPIRDIPNGDIVMAGYSKDDFKLFGEAPTV